MTAARDPELVQIRILALPLDVYQHSTEHHEELLREFALIQAREPTQGHTVPARLVQLVEELTETYAGMNELPRAELAAGIARGDATVDLSYVVPREIRQACIHLAELLAEADDYCRDGELLTMAPPPDAIAFRVWFLDEFVRQIDGLPPSTFASRQ
jgi:hypothetical protein